MRKSSITIMVLLVSLGLTTANTDPPRAMLQEESILTRLAGSCPLSTAVAINAASVSRALSQSASVERATLADLAFIAGQWRGELQGGITEENWSSASGDSMMGVFRYVKNGKAIFYEMLLIEATSNGPVLRLKHFNPGLKGWEEKDEVHSYPLVELQKDRAVFERPDKQSRLIFHRTSESEISIWLEQIKDGKRSPQEFKYRLAK